MTGRESPVVGWLSVYALVKIVIPTKVGIHLQFDLGKAKLFSRTAVGHLRIVELPSINATTGGCAYQPKQ
jgi:hypothetical protein